MTYYASAVVMYSAFLWLMTVWQLLAGLALCGSAHRKKTEMVAKRLS